MSGCVVWLIPAAGRTRKRRNLPKGRLPWLSVRPGLRHFVCGSSLPYVWMGHIMVCTASKTDTTGGITLIINPRKGGYSVKVLVSGVKLPYSLIQNVTGGIWFTQLRMLLRGIMPSDDRMSVDERRQYLKLVAPRYARAERVATSPSVAAGARHASPVGWLVGNVELRDSRGRDEA